jgi:hypothetical protein
MNNLTYFEDLKQLKLRGIKFIDDFAINFSFKKSELFKIQELILKLINNNEKYKKFKNYNDVVKYLNKTNFYHLNRDLDLMVDLEKIVINSFKKRGILTNYIKGIEFPIGIRIVHPNSPKQLNNKLQTTSIHCDPWAGEPNDMINAVSYIHVPNLSSKLNIFKTTKKNILKNSKLNKFYKSRFFIHSKYYNREISKFSNKESIQLNHKNGEIFLFNGFVPHNTIRNGSDVRISLEFRFRTKFPYNNLSRFLAKINRRGRYWLIPNKNIKNFNHRLEDELKNLSKNKRFKKIKTLRKKELNLFNL